MIYFKTEILRPEFDKLRDLNPALWAVVHTAAAYVDRLSGDNTVVTSVDLDQPNSVHGHWRGVDLRIAHPDREVRSKEAGWNPDIALDACDYLNKAFQYDATRPDFTVCTLHGEGLHYHAHLQTCGRWWK